MDNNNNNNSINSINIKFDDSSEINATREVLEDLLCRQYIRDSLSVYDYARIKNLVKQLWRNITRISSNNTFFYRGYNFTLIKVHDSTIADKVICFIIGTERDTLIPWFSENTDIVETGKMPPDDLLKVIDDYLNV